MTNLKNYKSRSALANIFADIKRTLISHGAKQIVEEYKEGEIVSISFLVSTAKGEIGIRLPARSDRVAQIFEQQGLRYQPDQPYRTSWATIRDWISAQMALIDWEMVKMEEVFLPYAVDQDGRTFFEKIEEKGFRLDSGK
jgi:hypothetical protein